jgi:hypothetical protein
MAKQRYIKPTSKNFFTFVLLLSFLLSLALIFFLLSSFLFVNVTTTTCTTPINATRLSCTGRYIYIQKLPERFNLGLVRNCHNLSCWTDMCQVVDNYGFGQLLTDTSGTLVPAGVWYAAATTVSKLFVQMIFCSLWFHYSINVRRFSLLFILSICCSIYIYF